MPNLELIGLDIGQAKTGLARASTIARLAEPIGSVETKKLVLRLSQLIKDHDVGAVVVGLPRNLDGENTAQTAWVRDFVKRLKTEVKADYFWQDEALTSQIAMSDKQITNSKGDEHSLAAAIILQDFLDTPVNQRTLVR